MQFLKWDVIMLLFVVWVIFHSNALYLVEPEGKEWVPFPWCQTSQQWSWQCGIFTAVQAKGSAQLCPFPVGFVTYWVPGCLEMCQALGHQDVWFCGAAQARNTFECFLTGLWIFLQACWRFFFQTEVCTIFVTLEVVLTIPFIHFFPEINSSIFLDLSFFLTSMYHHNYGLSYESLKSFCCGNIFVNSTPVYSVFY